MGNVMKGFTMAFGAYFGVMAASGILETLRQHVTVTNTIEDMVEDLIEEVREDADE